MKNFLAIENLTKSYGTDIILKDINIAIKQGEFLVLLGPSGCGKSTLLNCITGLTSIDEGTIHINETCVNEVHPSERNIAMVFQSYALYPNMTVRKNISFGMKIRKVEQSTIDEKVLQVAKLLKINEHLDKKPAQLSGGQRQRVAIARALVRKPDIFLFDEPLSNLDAKLRMDMRTELKKLHRTLKATIVYVTHDQIEALTLANRIVVMLDGEVVQFGTPDEIYNQPRNLFVARFIGAPMMNILSGRLQYKKANKHPWSVQLIDKNTGKSNILVPLPAAIHSKMLEKIYNENNEILMGIRPEFINESIRKAHLKNAFSIESKVEVVEPVGTDTFVVCNLANHEITARLEAQTQIKAGDALSLKVDLDHIHLFDAQSGNRIN